MFSLAMVIEERWHCCFDRDTSLCFSAGLQRNLMTILDPLARPEPEIPADQQRKRDGEQIARAFRERCGDERPRSSGLPKG
jgi:hypothetical protein